MEGRKRNEKVGLHMAIHGTPRMSKFPRFKKKKKKKLAQKIRNQSKIDSGSTENLSSRELCISTLSIPLNSSQRI
jgi:hypothetical protein